MRTLGKTAIAFGFAVAMAIGGTVSAGAFEINGPGFTCGSVTTIVITTMAAAIQLGTVVRPTGLFRAVSVSRIVMVRGTTDTDGIVKHAE